MASPPNLQRVLDRLARLSIHDPYDPDLRMVVQARVRNACEYCLMPTGTRFHIDHILPTSRWRDYLDGKLLVQPVADERGPNHLDNFAWSCPFCNASKGQRVSSRIGRRSAPIFHPRRQRWEDHFILTDRHLLIVGLSDVGRATERTLAFNDPQRNGALAARHSAIVDGVYPPAWARGWGY